jgi:hypothetical protein
VKLNLVCGSQGTGLRQHCAIVCASRSHEHLPALVTLCFFSSQANSQARSDFYGSFQADPVIHNPSCRSDSKSAKTGAPGASLLARKAARDFSLTVEHATAKARPTTNAFPCRAGLRSTQWLIVRQRNPGVWHVVVRGSQLYIAASAKLCLAADSWPVSFPRRTPGVETLIYRFLHGLYPSLTILGPLPTAQPIEESAVAKMSLGEPPAAAPSENGANGAVAPPAPVEGDRNVQEVLSSEVSIAAPSRDLAACRIKQEC